MYYKKFKLPNDLSLLKILFVRMIYGISKAKGIYYKRYTLLLVIYVIKYIKHLLYNCDHVQNWKRLSLFHLSYILFTK
jgi:hypothetical protein